MTRTSGYLKIHISIKAHIKELLLLITIKGKLLQKRRLMFNLRETWTEPLNLEEKFNSCVPQIPMSLFLYI